jgi:hypothetical protein
MTKSLLTLSIAAMFTIPFAARASLITGVLNFTGEANISSTMATPGSIVFTGNTFTVVPSVGGFAVFNGTDGTILPITNPPDAVDTPLDQPFISFAVAPNITITLTNLDAGIDGSADCSIAVASAGQVCTPDTPDLSPYNLQNTSDTTSSASFNLSGVETDSLTHTSIGVTGSFSDPSVTMSYQDILELIAMGGTFTTPFSAQITTLSPTPEPSTLTELMMGFALVGIGLVYRKKLKRA